MVKLGPVFFVTGILLSILALAMLIPAAVDYYMLGQDSVAFLASSFMTLFVGLTLFFSNKENQRDITIRETFLLTTTSWVIITFFAMIPLLLSHLEISVTDAFFETMSAITTTGSTVLTGLDTMSPGILLWRALLQWLGGVGIVVFAMAILPMLRIGGMQLFRTESSDKSDKVLPRAAQISVAIGGVYILLTLSCMISLYIFGMSAFDAIAHAMATVATGGFSTHDASITYFNNAYLEYTLAIFMALSGVPFVLYVRLLRGNGFHLFRDPQVKWFFSIVLFAIVSIVLWLHYYEIFPWKQAIRFGVFNIISVATTTGFTSIDYSVWGSFAVTAIFLISVMGGCTGSTTGGIKVFRYQVLYQTAKAQVTRLIQPHAVIRERYNKKSVSEVVTSSVMGFFILFAFCFLLLALFLSFCGLDYLSSMSAAAATLANVGPGLGPLVGPSGNFSTIPDVAKWVLAFSMLLGRLEIFTVLVLFSPNFWKD